MRCPDCDGTGQEGGRDLTSQCPTCEGYGSLDSLGPDYPERDWIAEENLDLYTLPWGATDVR